MNRRPAWTTVALMVAVSAPSAFAATEIAGKAVSVVGKVLVRNASAPNAVGKPLRPGDAVSAGEVLNTSSDANAKLLMTDKTVVDLGPSTLFKIDEYQLKAGGNRNVGLSMSYGKVRAVVNQAVSDKGRFRFRTQTATMGVRGTEFVVQSDIVNRTGVTGGTPGKAPEDAKTQITVVEGKVEVAQPAVGAGQAAKPVMLTPGTQLTTAAVPVAEGGKAAPVEIKQLSKQETVSVAREAKVSDQTFVQAVVIDSNTGTKSEGGGDRQGGPGQDKGGPPPKDQKPMAAAAVLNLVGKDMQVQEQIAIKPEAFAMVRNPFDQPPAPVPIGQPVNLKVVFTP